MSVDSCKTLCFFRRFCKKELQPDQQVAWSVLAHFFHRLELALKWKVVSITHLTPSANPSHDSTTPQHAPSNRIQLQRSDPKSSTIPTALPVTCSSGISACRAPHPLSIRHPRQYIVDHVGGGLYHHAHGTIQAYAAFFFIAPRLLICTSFRVHSINMPRLNRILIS